MKKINEYLTTGVAAKHLGVTVYKLQEWAKLGKIKFHRSPINNHFLWDIEDLNEIMAKIQVVEDQGVPITRRELVEQVKRRKKLASGMTDEEARIAEIAMASRRN